MWNEAKDRSSRCLQCPITKNRYISVAPTVDRNAAFPQKKAKKKEPMVPLLQIHTKLSLSEDALASRL